MCRGSLRTIFCKIKPNFLDFFFCFQQVSKIFSNIGKYSNKTKEFILEIAAWRQKNVQLNEWLNGYRIMEPVKDLIGILNKNVRFADP